MSNYLETENDERMVGICSVDGNSVHAVYCTYGGGVMSHLNTFPAYRTVLGEDRFEFERFFLNIKEWPVTLGDTPHLPQYWNWFISTEYADIALTNGKSVFTKEHWEKIRTKSQSIQVTAASMLTAALGHMEDRAKTYDAPGGERSMGKTVAAFNTITGLEMTEEQGWLFMEILKQVRSQQGNYRADNYEDMVAYAALRGECAARERGNK